MAQGVDAIVIAPADSRALVPVLSKALRQKIVVVNIDNKLDEATLQQSGIDIPFVGPDNRAGAHTVGASLARHLQRGDRVAILEGIPTAFNAQQRRLGFEDAMREAGVEVAAVQSAHWEQAEANTVSAAMLREHPGLKAILASNDNMALGAAAAVRQAGRTGQVQVVGFDNIAAVHQLLRGGAHPGDRRSACGPPRGLRHRVRPADPARRGEARGHADSGGSDHRSSTLMKEPDIAEPLLQVRGIEKRYAAPVLIELDLDLRSGDIHALMGANGAGKSTLSRIICGLTPADRGTMTLAGQRYSPRSRQEAQRAGVQLVAQELNLVPTLSIAENLFLTDLPQSLRIRVRDNAPGEGVCSARRRRA